MSIENFFGKHFGKPLAKQIIDRAAKETGGENNTNPSKSEELARTIWRAIEAAAYEKEGNLLRYSAQSYQCLEKIRIKLVIALKEMFYNNNTVIAGHIQFHVSTETVKEIAKSGFYRFKAAALEAMEEFLQERNLQSIQTEKEKDEEKIRAALEKKLEGLGRDLVKKHKEITTQVSAIDALIANLRDNILRAGPINPVINTDLQMSVNLLSMHSQQANNIQWQIFAINKNGGFANSEETYLNDLITQQSTILGELNKLSAKVTGIENGMRYALPQPPAPGGYGAFWAQPPAGPAASAPQGANLGDSRLYQPPPGMM